MSTKMVICNLVCSIIKTIGDRPCEAIPSIEPAGTTDRITASSVLLDKLDEIGDSETEIYFPDVDVKIYKKEDVAKSYELDEVSSISYVAEAQDCDDFAAELFGEFAGLVWTNVHALNWFYDENTTFWWIEPQTRKLSRTLETWQGRKVRFFLAR